MLKRIKQSIFPLLIAFSALSVSASAAFYSVFGLSKLFAGATTEVIIMAGSLEVAKLVIASLLYQYWKTLMGFLRTYLTIACFILIVITSAGIYGFLSAAYQETANKASIVDKEIAFYSKQRDFYQEDVNRYETELSLISENISNLSQAKAQQIQVRDTNSVTGYRTTVSTAELRLATSRLETEENNRNNIQSKRSIAADSLKNIEIKILELESNTELAAELGPLKYLSNLTGISMDRIINWLLLVIIFVFDPLAVALVIAANFAFTQIMPKTKVNLYREEVPVEEENWDNERMDVIGQNGNEGLHYEEEIAEMDSADLPEDLQWVNKKEETYAEGGYMQSETSKQPSLSFAQEAAEINRIMGKDLTAEQVERLKNSKLTRTFNNDDDDLKIHY